MTNCPTQKWNWMMKVQEVILKAMAGLRRQTVKVILPVSVDAVFRP
jgi:hypothetical protein